jgi:hypothetical protein
MARIELRDCDVRFKDGLAGAATVNQAATPPEADDTTLTLDGIVLNTRDTDLIPVGARFTIAGETVQQVHVVTARTPADTGPTTQITFSPKLGAGTYADGGAVTFQANQIDIKIGDGNLTYTEHTEYQYLLDRGDLDTVREGNQVPMDVKLEAVFEHITTGTSEAITPMDALKGVGSASEWVSASSDPCEPYAVDVEVIHTPPCGTAQIETTLFPDFRADTREVNYKEATISLTGKCNATEPTVTRGAAA